MLDDPGGGTPKRAMDTRPVRTAEARIDAIESISRVSSASKKLADISGAAKPVNGELRLCLYLRLKGN